MKLSYSLDENLRNFKKIMPVGKSFDVLERIVEVSGRKFYLYFIDGFAKDTNLEYVRRDMSNLDAETMKHIHTGDELAERAISSIEVVTETEMDKIGRAHV